MIKATKKEEVKEVPTVKAPDPKPQGDGCVECGKPKAPGQTYVCAEHVRNK